jgi:hypothetical protein
MKIAHVQVSTTDHHGSGSYLRSRTTIHYSMLTTYEKAQALEGMKEEFISLQLDFECRLLNKEQKIRYWEIRDQFAKIGNPCVYRGVVLTVKYLGDVVIDLDIPSQE